MKCARCGCFREQLIRPVTSINGRRANNAAMRAHWGYVHNVLAACPDCRRWVRENTDLAKYLASGKNIPDAGIETGYH